jgi:hypothetical protein
MRLKRILGIGTIAAVVGVGAAVAAHVRQVDPATVPTGFLVAHNAVEDVPVASISRAVRNGTDIFVVHSRFEANQRTIWHTHPGPAFVTVRRGSFTYQDVEQGACTRRTYRSGTGFVDRGFGHVHRSIAGPSGADIYTVYLLPRGTEEHLIPAARPAECNPSVP